MSSSQPNSPQPLRSAMKTDDDSERTPPLGGSAKVVQIAEPEIPQSEDPQQKQRQYSASVAKRLSGRLPAIPVSSSRSSLVSLGSAEQSPSQLPDDSVHPQSPHRHRHHYVSQKLLSQVGEWLEHERKKKTAKKQKVPSRRKSPQPSDKEVQEPGAGSSRPRSDSVDSQSSEVSLDRLQRIIEDSMAAMGLTNIPRFSPKLGRRPSSQRKHHPRAFLQRTASSDTDYLDNDVVVPTCDAILDNSKTMAYNAGKSTDDLTASGKRDDKEKQAWTVFKNEIVRLAHTLKLKGWRKVPLEGGDSISVERLSGALTNAVYVVSPPRNLDTGGKKPPPKLLLRIYGPHVEHLIDRENELGVLRRLARKKIGPRLLGCFTNGRFEQYFNSTTLTPSNLREPETSKQIAKRMKELHDGIEVLEEERDEGPAVWKNWDRWLANVEKKILALDEEVSKNKLGDRRGSSTTFAGKGYVCGVEWHRFKAMVEKYRNYLNEVYKSPKEIRERLVFAHNDTQYGNILRIRPDDETSPLLQPANEHKQLIVIDFEYAAANLPGLEFANHFSEWAYNYHDAIAPHACTTSRYPNLEQQRRFIRSYVDHRSQFPHAGSTPRLTPLDTPGTGTPLLVPTSSSSSIVDFMLDARVPPGGWKEEERLREEQTEARVKELLEETRLWRAANSAQWIAWGIVQAKVPGVEAEADDAASVGSGVSLDESEADEFDYLSYAQERALFFWGDCVLLGLVKAEELPEDIRASLKTVDY